MKGLHLSIFKTYVNMFNCKTIDIMLQCFSRSKQIFQCLGVYTQLWWYFVFYCVCNSCSSTVRHCVDAIYWSCSGESWWIWFVHYLRSSWWHCHICIIK